MQVGQYGLGSGIAYHPKNHGFSSFAVVNSDKPDSAIRPDTEPHIQYRYIHIWIAVLDDNSDWYTNNQDCEYLKQVHHDPNETVLPIAATTEELDVYVKLLSDYWVQNNVM
jgi:hypothetical protein